MYTPAPVRPVSLSVQLDPPGVALNIFSPRAAITLDPNVATISTSSVDALVWGTIAFTYFEKPLILLYPPSMSGSKLINSSACPGFIVSVD